MQKQPTCNTLLFVFILFVQSVTISATAQTPPQLPPSELIMPARSYSTSFRWLQEGAGATRENYAALLVPVKLKNCPRQFYMQFDLGSPYTIFYRNMLEAINSAYPGTINVPNTGNIISSPEFALGKDKITASQLRLRLMSSKMLPRKKNAVVIIGTLGSDFIDGRTLTIDYPGRKITVSTDSNSVAGMTEFYYMNRSVIFPAFIKGKRTMLYFDTGASAYELLTDKKTAEAMALPGRAITTRKSDSWDRVLTANTVVSADSIMIGTHHLPLKRATYMEGMSESQVSAMKKMGIGGLTGNRLFLDYKLIIDTKKRKFALIK